MTYSTRLNLGATAKLLLWLRADMGVVLSGSNVVLWSDQSGKGWVFTPGDAGFTVGPTIDTVGIKGNKTIVFNGSTGLATSSVITSSKIFTIFIVQKCSTISGTQSVFLNGSSSALYVYQN